MTYLNDCIAEYTSRLKEGKLQIAYKGIMSFMSQLKAHIESTHTEYNAGALYFGYMDMTYFALTPPPLKNLKLKVAVVYLHKKNRFEIWLAAANRAVQGRYIESLKGKNTCGYALSEVSPGVDSILWTHLAEKPDFDNAEKLCGSIETAAVKFINGVYSILNIQNNNMV